MGAVSPSGLEINAFADGELTGEAKEEIRHALEADEGLRATAAWRDTLGRQLHEAYDGVLAEALPARTQRLLRPATNWSLPKGTRRAAAALAFAAVAAGIGYVVGLQSPPADGGIDRIARMSIGAHQIYASEVRHPVEVPGSDSTHLAKWLGKRLGLEFTAPDINDAGFALVGGRLLAEGPRPAGLLMYEDATGRRVTLYMEKWPSSDDSSMRYLSGNGLNTYYWVDGNFACAVTGNLDSDKLKTVSERLYASLEGR